MKQDPPEPVRWLPLIGVCAALVAGLLAVAGRYGYYMDELYFRVSGGHLDWGYADQPPLVALLAKVQVTLFGDSVFALRIIPALLAGVTVLVTALISRELGGSHRAQLLTAVATAGSLASLVAGHVLHPTAVDHVAWITVCWLVIRLIRTSDTRLWLAVGAVVGVGLLAKYLVLLLVFGLGAALLLVGPRRFDGRFAAGAGIGVLLAAPTLVWQALNGWPQFGMASELSSPFGVESVIGLLIGSVLMIGPLLTPVWVIGLVAVFRRPQWRPYRAFGVAYLLIFALLAVLGAQARYTEGLLTVFLAMGCVVVAEWASKLSRSVLIGAAVVGNTAIAAVLSLPVLPIEAFGEDSPLGGFGEPQLGQVGWPELTAQIGEVYHALPAADRARAVIYGENYAQAGAVDRYGPGLGLPSVYSGHNSYADFARPADDKTVVIAFGAEQGKLTPLFAKCEVAGQFRHELPVTDRGRDILVCRDPVQPWSQLWPRFRWLGTF
ncbi:glycosyltransferase family 39 protein [Allokutzneria sp. A3M-2-11 16]|uniref:ArnT family glycosyltransferase n=1 Tax=Allokutzneria sp. A3M-2-11 16 TaxID=2962043 RepID=UPI0020B7C31B|nr:glycosyltransferase family 39 protein [Allokutzneria sp. A3M-2-11 16]MCP3804976.1 glycosyltransferase family 39 protein [Allokutzneria sp. A3M-2-11 16]